MEVDFIFIRLNLVIENYKLKHFSDFSSQGIRYRYAFNCVFVLERIPLVKLVCKKKNI